MTRRTPTFALAALVALAACDRLTDTVEPAAEPAAALPAVSSASLDADATVEALDDILDRIIPSLGHHNPTRVLERALNDLRTEAAAANPERLAQRLSAAHEAVERLARADGDDAELNVIRLVLEFARLTDPRAP